MPTTRDTPPERPAAPLRELVDVWVRDGVVSREQGDALLTHSGASTRIRPAAGRPTGGSLAVEALGYLGGAVVVVAALLLTSMFWDRLSDAVRLGILAVVAAGLIGGGFAVPRAGRGTSARLRSVLWLAGTVAATGALVIGIDEYTGLDGARADLAIAAAAFVVAAALWLRHRVLVQQIAVFAALIVATTAAFVIVGAQSTSGFAIWVIGLCWFALGQLRRLRPTTAVRVLGALTALVSLIFTVDLDAGIVLGLLTATAAVVFAVLVTDLPLLVVGAIGMLVFVQIGMHTWLDNSLLAVVALLLVGLGLVGIAIRVSRRTPGRARRRAFAR